MIKNLWMNNFKNIVLVITLICGCSLDANSQTTLSIRGGFLGSRQIISNWEEGSVRISGGGLGGSQSGLIGGLNVGPIISHSLNERFKFITGLMFSQKGQNEYLYSQNNFSGDAVYRDRINYLVIPVEFTFTKKPDKKSPFFWKFGFYFAHGLGGSTRYELESSSSQSFGYSAGRLEEGEVFIRSQIMNREAYGNYDLIVKPWDIGGILGFGLKIKKMPVSLTYQAGFLNTHPKIINVRPYTNDRKSNEREKRNNSFLINIDVPIKSFKSDSQ